MKIAPWPLTIPHRQCLDARCWARWHHGWTIVAVACLSVSVASGTRAVFGVLLVALMGILAAITALGVGLGPAAGGWIFDQTGTYQPAFLLTLGSTVAAAGCVWLAAPRRGALGPRAERVPAPCGATAPVAARPAGGDRP